ncbi:MAG: T9SS type A sorting domain-containing protein, partial [bacterium]|nr:T9SS type A sorting domain-containing protein [bacterium]
LWLEWDPQNLAFEEAAGADAEAGRSLVWTRTVQADRLEMVAAPTTGRAFEGDIAVLRFRRLTPTATDVRLRAAVGRDAAGVVRTLDLPAALSVSALPSVAILYPAHPNPFNPETVIPFFIPAGPETRTEVRIFDLLGRPVRTLTATTLTGGHHRVVWHGRDDDGRQAAAGVYLVELRAGDRRQVRKVMLLK